ncbi:DUF2145 domain-containing protein [Piscinibacter sakaiensis]|uniref:DUF2145 domain-containing protein n=1 Tax=Piscinibacter sakaiensis TaxID=1547922 RepID=UPI003AAAF441
MKAHRLRRLIGPLGVVLALLAGGNAWAGRQCDPQVPRAANVERAMDLAAATSRALEASGAQVVVLARVGQDLREYGLRYSHLGLAYRDDAAGRDGATGRWRVVHKLNQCAAATAMLFRQGLAEFVLDDLFEYQVGIVVLDPALQARLLPILKDNGRLAQMHEPAYNMLAYPWARRYQQSNQWAIETLAMAQEPAATDRERAQAWLKLQGYEPTSLNLGPLTRLGARVGSAHIAFDDHPDSKRFGNRIETVTVDSVFSWLTRSGLGARPVVVQ